MKTPMELKLLRIQKKIKAKDLAKYLNVSNCYISMLEAGKQPIPAQMYLDWVRILEKHN